MTYYLARCDLCREQHRFFNRGEALDAFYAHLATRHAGHGVGTRYGEIPGGVQEIKTDVAAPPPDRSLSSPVATCAECAYQEKAASHAQAAVLLEQHRSTFHPPSSASGTS